MRIEAHAKINWALAVKGQRADRYHLLDTLIQRIHLCDLIDLALAPDIHLKVTGNNHLGNEIDNLAFKAAQSLREASGYTGGALISLHKRIPTQAGLGGGSADAAAVLLGLNQLWGLRLPLKQLEKIGIKLGADVPCCLYPGLSRVRGIGETVEPVQGGKEYHLVLLQPEYGLSTKLVFDRFDREEPQEDYDLTPAIGALTSGNHQAIRKSCHNQLQKTAAGMLPEIDNAIHDLLGQGAVFAQMTGSGSAVFGLFEDESTARASYDILSLTWKKCLLTSTMAG